MLPRAVFSLLCSFLLILPAQSQDRASEPLPAGQPVKLGETIRFRQIPKLETAARQAIVSIHQDAVGFMWFGSDDGLYRHDGTSVRSYRPIPFDATTVSDPWISGIASSGATGFWATTKSGGLNRYDAMTDAFVRYDHVAPARLNAVVADEDSILWIATNFDGLVRYDLSTGRATSLKSNPNDETSLPSDRITALTVDALGVLWVATFDAGVCRLDRLTGLCSNYANEPGNPKSLPSNRVLAFAEDVNGQMWIGTSDGGKFTDGLNGIVGGVARFDALSDSFIRYPPIGNERGVRDVLSVLSDPGGNILIGSDAGLNVLDPTTGVQQSYRHGPGNSSSIAEGAVYSLFLDDVGVIWIGTDSGVSYFQSEPSPFQHFTHDPGDPNSLSDPEVWSLLEDENGIIWVGTSYGLNSVDRSTGKITRYLPDPSDPGSLTPGIVMGINQTKDKELWVTTRRGALHRFDRASGKVTERFLENSGRRGGVPSDNPWFFLEDQKGRLWITSGGAGCLQEMIQPGEFVQHCHDPLNVNTPAHDFARQMIEARDGTLWLGTWGGGLDRIDPETLNYTHYRHNPENENSVSSDFVMSVHEDPRGILWLGTYGAGLTRFDPTTEEFRHFTSHNSDLPSDVVYEIQADDTGCLWASTNAGLVRFDPVTETFRTFGVEDGVQDLEFDSGASFRSISGELFFGGVNGFNAFFPEHIRSDPRSPVVVMTTLQAGGVLVDRSGPDTPILAALPYVKEIRLRANQRDIAIGFAGLSYVGAENHRYRYRLDGYDEEWRQAGKERTATYTNLDRGKYMFRVAVSNNDGVWDDEALHVAIIAEPYWYETIFAKALYLLSGVGLLAWLLYFRQKRTALQHRLEIEHLETEKLRQVDKTRSIFFANVSHEFRTPLTLTLGPVDDVLAGLHGAVSEAAQAQLQLARRNAGRVLDLINQILDVARLEAGRTRLRVRRIDLGIFTDDVAAVFMPLAERKAITFSVDTEGERVRTWVDPVQFEKVLSNLLSNAFKFTPNGGTIRVIVEEKDQQAFISVRDNGPGIPASELPFVFDRFHQVDESHVRLQPGTGIGLALSREIVQLHGGLISVESEEGFGSTFTVSLPVDNKFFEENQIDSGPPTRAKHSAARPSSMSNYSLKKIAEFDGLEAATNDLPVFDDSDLENQSHSGDGFGHDAVEDERTTILVVEDHDEVREYIRFHLESDYRVLEASDGQQGLEMVRSLLPDLVLSDVMMPRLDGVEMCRILKSDPDTDFIPVVLLTAKASHEDQLDGLRGRADAYLTKPFDPEELRLWIANLISSARRLAIETKSLPRPTMELSESPVALKSSDDTFLDRVQDCIDDDLSDESFTVERLAEALGVSRTALFRNLRRLADKSPSEMIRDVRLERAAQMLEANAGNVSEIAYATGFKSLSSFSRAFTKKFNCRPSAFLAERPPVETPQN